MRLWKNLAKGVSFIGVLGLWMASQPVLAGSASTGDCGPGTVKVCGTVTVPNTSGATANDFHFYMYQNDRPNVQVMGATASSAGCDTMSTSLGTDNGTGSPPPGNHGASVDASSCTPIPPGGSVSVQICLCMNERNCIKFKDIHFTSDGTPIEPGGGGGGGPPPKGGWRIQRPYRGGNGGSGLPGGSGGQGAQEGDGGTGKWIHLVCIENDDTRWVVLENLKLLASMTDYANPNTDIDWASIEPVADIAGRPPVCIPPGGKWCFPFETTGAYLGGHVYQQYRIRPEFTDECSAPAMQRVVSLDEGGDNTMTVVGDHPPETPLTEVLDIANHLDYQTSNDYYRTTATTAVTFGEGAIPAIPADFFGPGSEPFTGTVQFTGAPVDPATSDADTIVRRHGEAYLPFEGSVDTIPIELLTLSLMSVHPITVTYQSTSSQLYDVFMTLDPGFPAMGSMTIQRTSPSGGTFTSTLQLLPVFTFAPAGGGPPTPPLPSVLPYPIQQVMPHGWQYAPPVLAIANSGPNFFPTAGSPLEWDAPDGSPHTVVPALPTEPFGHAVYFTCSAASPGIASIELLPGEEVFNITVITNMNAEQKRDQWVSTLGQQAPQYYPAAVGADAFSMNGFSPGTSVQFATGNTAEIVDKLRTTEVHRAQIAFANAFNPFDGQGQPAVFTAGIVTDVGELTAQVSAAELNFQTDGPIICQALFQRLAPHAPPFGAQINYAGDRLEVYFDPAYTVSPSGISFGTTSGTDGCFGQIVLPCPPGDFDCDGDVDPADLELFAQCASGPAVPHDGSDVCRRADFDDDHDVDQSDFGGLQRCLSGQNNPADPDCAD